MERQMTNSTKIVYEHLKDYPTSTEGYHEISAPAVAAALCCEHMPTPDDECAAGPGRESARPDRRGDPVGAARSERRAG
jgi:hypothetical protein